MINIQSHEQNYLGGHDHYYYQLSFTGKPLKVMHVHETADTTLTDVYQYTYDNMERLLTATVSHDSGTAVQLASNTYDSLGRLCEQTLGNNSNGVVDYSYNVRGWTQGITSTHFSQTLYYEQPYTGATPCYNGNVSAVAWSSRDAMIASTPTAHHYTFDYDGLNRLTAAHYGAEGSNLSWNGYLLTPPDDVHDYSTTYSYDLNGNITSLTRKGVWSSVPVIDYTSWGYGDIDDLTLEYDGNQLRKVTDLCDELSYAGAMDFKDGSDAQTEYSWDANGNMTKDLNKGITRIGYNELNLPSSISYSDGHSVRYTYAADGRKLRVDYLVAVVGTLPGRGPGDHNLDPPPHPGGDWNPLDPDRVLLRLDYCGNHVYRNGSLERTTNDYGYLADSTYYYYIKDYQGNVRAVINQAGALKEVNNYYPYGGLMGAATAGVQPLKYSGKELDRENGIDWYDFGARIHDPMLPMFTTQDPLAEQTPSISPYAYCAGNPIRYIDPSGLGWIEQDNRYFYNPMISSQDEATEFYGNNAKYLFNEGRLYATDQSYSYDLGAGGHIRNSSTGEIVSGEITTPAGSILVNDNLYYKQKDLDLFEELSNSNNIFAIYAYSTANDAYMLMQILSLGLFDKRHYTNPLTGSYSYSNLDGTPRYDATDAIPGIVLSLFPVNRATPDGLKLLSKMNAAQFSHTFKGSLSRLKPAERGAINKSINIEIDYINGYVGKGKPAITLEKLYNTYK